MSTKTQDERRARMEMSIGEAWNKIDLLTQERDQARDQLGEFKRTEPLKRAEMAECRKQLFRLTAMCGDAKQEHWTTEDCVDFLIKEFVSLGCFVDQIRMLCKEWNCCVNMSSIQQVFDQLRAELDSLKVVGRACENTRSILAEYGNHAVLQALTAHKESGYTL